MSQTAECLAKEPKCKAGDPCLVIGSGISNKLTAHAERRQNAQLARTPVPA